MKRFLCMILALVFALGTVGCTKTPTDTGDSAQDSTDSTAESTEENTADTADDGSLDVGSDTPGVDISKINESDYNIISVEDYLDKTLAAHLAQYIGFLSGYEFASSNGKQLVAMPDSWFEICNGPYAEYNSRNKHEDKLLYNDETQIWEVWNDDDFSIDILNQYIIKDMYEDYGTLASVAIKDGWIEYDVYDMGGGHRSYGAYGLFKNKGYLPPFIGAAEYGNLYAVNGEPYIANETLGMTFAGMPSLAAKYADIFTSVTSDRDSAIWGNFFSTMYSLAYFEDDIPTLIAEARKVVPDGCVVDQVIDEVLALRQKYPRLAQWRTAAKEAETLVHRDHYDLTSTRGESSINCSFILIGLLWGEGDFFETCRIISLAGHGGDSTTPVGLGIVAIINGMQDIPEEALAKTWQDGKGTVVNLPSADLSEGYWMYAKNLPVRILMADVVKMYQQNFESILAENGGFRYDGKYYIPKEELGDTKTLLYVDYEEGNVENATVIGNASVFTKTRSDSDTTNAFLGDYSLKLSGNPNADSGLYYTVSGLETGAQYRVESFIFSPTITTYMFARNVGDTGMGQYASVHSTTLYVKRELVFTATAETMEIGVMLKAGLTEFKYSQIDDLYVIKVEETELTDKVTVENAAADSKYSGVVNIKVDEKIEKEAYLKITFANPANKNIDGAITVNGEEYACAPFYKTGEKLSTQGSDSVYIAVLLDKDGNTLSIDFGTKNSVYIYDVSVVTVNERCG